MNSDTGSPPQLKAPAAICITLVPCTTGDLSKWKIIVVLPLITADATAGILFTVKSLALTVVVSTGPSTLIVKSLSGTSKKVISHPPLSTEQGIAVSESTPLMTATMASLNFVTPFIFIFVLSLCRCFVKHEEVVSSNENEMRSSEPRIALCGK